MSALRVRDCIGYLKYVLTELIPIARHTDMQVMVDEIIILKDYVNLINEINLSIGTVLYFLVSDCMVLLISQQEDLNQISEALIYAMDQALAILNSPQNTRLEKTEALLTTCQEQWSVKPQLVIYVQYLFVALGALTSRKETDLQDVNILEWIIAFRTTNLINR